MLPFFKLNVELVEVLHQQSAPKFMHLVVGPKDLWLVMC